MKCTVKEVNFGFW